MFVVFVVRLHTVSGGGELGRIGTARNDKKILKVKKQKKHFAKVSSLPDGAESEAGPRVDHAHQLSHDHLRWSHDLME